jgi:hypothetical protein
MYVQFPTNARPITGFSDYAVDQLGNVFSLRTPTLRQLKPGTTRNGYMIVSLRDAQGKTFNRYVHRLVLEAFVPLHDASRNQANHIDGNKRNNILINLSWTSASENRRHAVVNGLMNYRKKTLKHSEVHQICVALLAGQSPYDIAAGFGICRTSVSHIKTCRTWKAISTQYFSPIAA